MLVLDLGTIEEYDSEKQEFVYHEGGVVRFEYSLKAIYEWESKWKIPFLRSELTVPQRIDFYKLMALDPFDDKFLTVEVANTLTEYINDGQTATQFNDDNSKSNSNGSSRAKRHTAEEIYASMFAANIPLDFENRNFNRLTTILRIISISNEPPKKMNKQEILKQNSQLNAQRKAAMKTRG